METILGIFSLGHGSRSHMARDALLNVGRGRKSNFRGLRLLATNAPLPGVDDLVKGQN